MPRLWVLRHAKTSRDAGWLADSERPLAPRGRRACAALRRHCTAEAVRPELVLCSTALRTRQTLDGIRDALGEPEVVFEHELYGASADDLLARLRGVEAESVLLVGHNPGLHNLVWSLAQPCPLRDRVREGFPTGALATLDHDGRDGLAATGADLVAYVVPREL